MIHAATKGQSDPDTLEEAERALQKVPNWAGLNHYIHHIKSILCTYNVVPENKINTFFNSLAQAGHPAPWANPFKNHKAANIGREDVVEKRIVAPPESTRPANFLKTM